MNKGIGIAIIAGLALWALSKAKPASAQASSLLPTEKQPQPVQTTIQTYTGAPGEIAPVVKTVKDFVATYGMSESAAITTALAYAANPNDPQFATLSSRDKQNLANIVAEAKATRTTSTTAQATPAPTSAPTSVAVAEVTALIGSQPTASVQQLDTVANVYGQDSPQYQAVIDTAYEAAAAQAEATGGVVSWTSDEGYQALSLEASYYGYL